MAFFLIVPSVMIVSIVLVRALANRLGLQIFYKTLVTVAVLSIAAVFMTTKFAPAVGKDFFLRLGLIILAASLLATLINIFLIKRQRAEEERFTEEVKAAYAAEVQKKSSSPEQSPEPSETFYIDEFDEPPPRPNRYDEIRAAILSEEPQSVTEMESSHEESLITETEPSHEEPVVTETKPARNEPVVKKIDTPPAQKSVLEEIPDDQNNFPLEKVFKPLAVVKPVEADKPVKLEEKPDPAEKFPLQEVFKPLATVKPAEADKPIKPTVKPAERAEFFPLQEVFTPLSMLKPEKIEELTREERNSPPKVEPVAEVQSSAKVSKPVAEVQSSAKVSKPVAEVQPSAKVSKPVAEVKSSAKVSKPVAKVQTSAEVSKPVAEAQTPVENFYTLDEILDRAYAERDKGHVWQAIELYLKALESYRNDDYAPFVAIDLGNIYKEKALYSKAIKTYEDALTLPAVQRNATIKKDFLNNLRYLRIVRDVLLKHRASATPFTKLPKDILQEIDAAFQRMQLNSAQSK